MARGPADGGRWQRRLYEAVYCGERRLARHHTAAMLAWMADDVALTTLASEGGQRVVVRPGGSNLRMVPIDPETEQTSITDGNIKQRSDVTVHRLSDILRYVPIVGSPQVLAYVIKDANTAATDRLALHVFQLLTPGDTAAAVISRIYDTVGHSGQRETDSYGLPARGDTASTVDGDGSAGGEPAALADQPSSYSQYEVFYVGRVESGEAKPHRHMLDDCLRRFYRTTDQLRKTSAPVPQKPEVMMGESTPPLCRRWVPTLKKEDSLVSQDVPQTAVEGKQSRRIMLLLIGLSELRLISTDRKQTLLARRLTDVHRVIRAVSIMASMKSALTAMLRSERTRDTNNSAANRSTASLDSISELAGHHNCARCPMVQFDCMCRSIQGCVPEQVHERVLTRIGFLEPDAQESILLDYKAACRRCGRAPVLRSGSQTSAGKQPLARIPEQEHPLGDADEMDDDQAIGDEANLSLHQRNVILLSLVRRMCERLQTMHEARKASDTSADGASETPADDNDVAKETEVDQLNLVEEEPAPTTPLPPRPRYHRQRSQSGSEHLLTSRLANIGDMALKSLDTLNRKFSGSESYMATTSFDPASQNSMEGVPRVRHSSQKFITRPERRHGSGGDWNENGGGRGWLLGSAASVARRAVGSAESDVRDKPTAARRTSWRQAIFSRVVALTPPNSKRSSIIPSLSRRTAGKSACALLPPRSPKERQNETADGKMVRINGSAKSALPADLVKGDGRRLPSGATGSDSGDTEESDTDGSDEQDAGRRRRWLWHKLIVQVVLDNRMNKQRLLQEKERQAIERLKLTYEELAPANKDELASKWLAMLENNEAAPKPCRFNPYILQELVQQGVPRQLRGRVWRLLLEQHKFDRGWFGAAEKPPPYDLSKLLAQLTPHQHAILIDLGRTFPTHQYFKQHLGPGQLSLFNILKAYSLYDTDVGYCQGLSFIAGTLLMHAEEHDAFALLVDLMYLAGVRRQFKPDMLALQVHMYQLSRLLHDRHEDLQQHMEQHEIPMLFAAPWFLTLFASTFPLGFVARVFDFIFLSGSLEVVFRVGLVLLGNHKELIKQCNSFEAINEFLKTTLPGMGIIQMERVFGEVAEMDISRDLLAYEVEYNVLQEELLPETEAAASALHPAQRSRLADGDALRKRSLGAHRPPQCTSPRVVRRGSLPHHHRHHLPSSNTPPTESGADSCAESLDGATCADHITRLTDDNAALHRKNADLTEKLAVAHQQLEQSNRQRRDMQTQLRRALDSLAQYEDRLATLEQQLKRLAPKETDT